MKKLVFLPLVAALGVGLAGCNAVVLHPSGDVAVQQRDLLVEATAIMLVIIVPVMALTVLFAWRYRRSNDSARYEPNWDHSTELELVIWGAPLLIIICLGAMTWMGTHLLDPFRPLDRIAPNEAVAASARPLEVEVVSLDWKWLFFYPQYGIASVNELDAPVGQPIDFRITSATVMNSFFIPALAGQIYAMAGMETQLHAVMNKAGTFEGLSANYSGAGFSGMHFKFHALQKAAFDAWVAKVKSGGGDLSRASYLALAEPSQDNPVQDYAAFDPGLYGAILNECVKAGQTCLDKGAAWNVPAEPQRVRAAAAATSAAHGRQAMVIGGMTAASPAKAGNAEAPPSPISGAGLKPPPFSGPFQDDVVPPRMSRRQSNS